MQTVPGVSPVTNPQASKGGSDAEKIDKAETRVIVRGFDKIDRLTRGGKTSEQAKGKSTDKSKFGTWGPGYTPETDKSSNDKSKYGTYGPGYTPDKSSNDKSKYGTYGPGYTPDKSSNDKSKYGTYGPGYTPDKSSNDKSKYGTYGPGYTPDKSSNDKSKYGTYGPGYTPDTKTKPPGTNSGPKLSSPPSDPALSRSGVKPSAKGIAAQSGEMAIEEVEVAKENVGTPPGGSAKPAGEDESKDGTD